MSETTEHVRNTKLGNTLQIYAIGERVKDYKNKWNDLIFRMNTSRLTQKLQITNQTEDELLDDREDDGRIVVLG
jgi:hypothetical protein